MSQYFYFWEQFSELKGELSRSLYPGPTAPEFEFIKALTERVTSIATSATHIYWSSNQIGGSPTPSINRAKLDGTGVEKEWITWAGKSGYEVQITVDETHIYWAKTQSGEGSSNEIGRANLDGTEKTEKLVVTENQNKIRGITVDATHIYWIGRPKGFNEAIGRAKLDGTEVEVEWIKLTRTPEQIVLDSTHIYVNTGEGFIFRAKIDGTEPEEWFETIGETHGISIDSTYLYCLCWREGPKKGYIARISIATKIEEPEWLSLGSILEGKTPELLALSAPSKEPPVLTNPGTQDNHVGETVSLTIVATNTEEYQATGLPEGLSINSSTGKITGTPKHVGHFTVKITVKGKGGEVSDEFVWIIEPKLCVKPTDPGAPWELFVPQSIVAEPGDAIISASSGRLLLNENGKLTRIQSNIFGIEKYFKPSGKFFYNTAYTPSNQFITLAIISTKEQNPSHVFIGGTEVAEIEYHGSVVPMTFIIPKETTWEVKAAGTEELKSVAYAFFPSA
jgi:hypothetical protein